MKRILPLVLLAGLSVRAQASDPICLATPGNAVVKLMQQMRRTEAKEAVESQKARENRESSWWRHDPLPEEVPTSAQISLLAQKCDKGDCDRVYLVRLTWNQAGDRVRSVAATLSTCGTIRPNGQGEFHQEAEFKVLWR